MEQKYKIRTNEKIYKDLLETGENMKDLKELF